MKQPILQTYCNNWEEYYKSRFVLPEEAVKTIGPGDRIAMSLIHCSDQLTDALFARKDELNGVEIMAGVPLLDPKWFQPELEESFTFILDMFIGGPARIATDAKRATYLPVNFSNEFKVFDENRPEKKELDVFFVVLSPPDRNGFCSFGCNLWHKKSFCKRANKIIAEIDENYPTTYGDTKIHVSNIDYFVHSSLKPLTEEEAQKYLDRIAPEKREQAKKTLLSKIVDTAPGPIMNRMLLPFIEFLPQEQIESMAQISEPTEAAKGIAENLKKVIKDRDTIQTGVGRPSQWMVELGVFDNFVDLGIQTEMGSLGLQRLVQNGIATGKYKNIFPNRAVFTGFLGCRPDEIEFMVDNPIFEIYDAEEVVNSRLLALEENFVSINNGMQVDLTGQICSETQFGNRMINGQGGQPEMHLGAFYSKGGRAVILLPSTALDGSASTIVPQLDVGSLVTIPRHFADIIITEYGIARLLGKNHRERAEELIGIAHPDFRAELRKEAKSLFWP